MYAAATGFYLQELASKFESESELTFKRMRTARTIMKLVQLHKTAPVAQATIRFLPEVVCNEDKLKTLSEELAQAIIDAELKNLRTMLPKDPVAFEREKGAFAVSTRPTHIDRAKSIR